jgi:hypothetical protein
MKIQIIKKAEKKSAIASCPHIIEYMPPERAKQN